jgi:protein involved in polysaccharide export with SLBB domain
MRNLVLKICLLASSLLFAVGAAAENTREPKEPEIKVTVAGCVGKPGVVTLKETRTLTHALALAGSITRYGERRSITVTSKTGEERTYDLYEMSKKGDRGQELKDGDVIFVPER